MVKGACLAVSSLLLVVVAGCDANPGQGTGTRLGRAADGPFTAFVADEFSGRVTPFNTLTRRVFKAIRVGSNPWAIAVTPDGSTAYVANGDSQTVTPISTATNKAGSPINAVPSPVRSRSHRTAGPSSLSTRAR